MKLLLHTCCAPCLIHPLQQLKAKGYAVEAFFYNPNIHPCVEYHSRRKAVEQYAQEVNVGVEVPEYCAQDFLEAVSEAPEKPQRCLLCWKLRLKETAQAAKHKGIEYFTTTFLVSPYQDQEALKKLGEETAQESGVAFYYEDFRPGFRAAHNEAHAKGIYCQKYCGCLYSQSERGKK